MSDSTVRKRKRSRRKRKKIIALVVFFLLMAALLCTLSLTVFFPVKEINVVGNSLYSDDEIIENSGIEFGENVIMLSESDAKYCLQSSLPFVDEIEISRNLSGKITIKITEAAEKYCFKAEELYYSTDTSGRILKTYEARPENITFIECGVTVNGTAVEKIEYENSKNAKQIDAILSQTDSLSLKADYINLTNLFDISAVFDSKYTVLFGSDSYMKEKLDFFAEILKSGKMKGDSGTVDLSEYTPENPKAYFDNMENQEN